MNIYLNGNYRQKEEVKELLEPGFLFGWGVFETLRVYDKTPAFLTEHLQRLKKGAECIGLAYPAIDYAGTIKELLRENNLNNAYLRISLFKQRDQTGVLIYADTFTYYPETDYQKGYTVVTAPYRRHPQSLYSKVKSISYLESRLAWFYAQQCKKDEAIFLSTDEFVQEGSRSNIFMVSGDMIKTPSLACGVLDGITRRQLLQMVHALGLKCAEGAFSLQEFISADEVFITSSLMEVMPVREIENHPVGKGSAGPITLRLLQEYRRRIN